jgi:hypothetical protein
LASYIVANQPNKSTGTLSPLRVGNGLDFDYSRDERTPGAVAVIQQTEEARGNFLPGTSQNFSGAAEQTQSPTLTETNSTIRLMGFGKLRNLLQPSHKYFEDKWGQIKFWQKYLEKSSGRTLVYPKVNTSGRRDNPYRKYQLNRQCSARSAKAVLEFADLNQFSELKVIDMTSTMPEKLSEYLSNRKDHGRDVAWSASDRQWQKMEELGLIGSGYARHSNLHPWSSENPLKSHYHNHDLLLNYEQVNSQDVPVESQEFPGNPCSVCGCTTWLRTEKGFQCSCCFPLEDVKKLTFHKREWYRDPKTHHYYIWSRAELALVKAIRLEININLSRKYGLEGVFDSQKKLYAFYRKRGLNGLFRLLRLANYVNSSHGAKTMRGWVDVWVSYIDMRDDIGRAKFVNTLAYNGRSWQEDYAYYSNKHPDCEMPPKWLEGYGNKSRPFGYWRDIVSLIKVLRGRKLEKIKLSPYTAETLEYQGPTETRQMLEDSAGSLIAVDLIRGKAIERYLSDDDIQWLKNVDFQRWRYINE